MLRRMLLPVLLAGAVAGPALAHEPTRGPNGGQLVDFAPGHAELVARDGELTLRVFDAQDRPVPLRGASGSAIVLAGGRQQTVPLAPATDTTMVGRGGFAAARGMRVVVSVLVPGQPQRQARFTPAE